MQSRNLKIFGEITGDILSASIAHEARCIEFTHVGIDEWHTSLSSPPQIE